jgi:hypothetical protein
MYNTVIAMQHVGTVYDLFQPVHPELAEKLMVCIQGYEVIAGVIKGFAETAWGKDEVNWESWRALGAAFVDKQELIDPQLSHLYTQSAHKTYKHKK